MKQNLFVYFLFLIGFVSCTKTFENVNPPYETSAVRNAKPYSTSVTLEQAEKLVVKFLSDMKTTNTTGVLAASQTPKISVTNSMTITKNNTPYFHLVNTTQGFVIVSSDSLFNPVLAYDSISNLNLDLIHLHAGLSLWLKRETRQLDYVRTIRNNYVDSVTTVNKLTWVALGATRIYDTSQIISKSTVGTNSKTSVNGYAPVLFKTEPITLVSGNNTGILCTARWGQDNPFNQYCPVDGASGGTYGNRDPAGCVPVAMAQIMYFWKVSNKGYNFNLMVPEIIQSNSSTWPANNPTGFTGTAHMISDIGLTPGNFYTDFTHGFTSSKFTHYAAGGSDSNPEYCETVFKSFGYTSAATSQSYATQMISGQASNTYYMGKLTDECQARRPVVVSGFTGRLFNGIQYSPDPGSEAHAWMCDGSNKQTYRMGTRLWYRNNDGSTYYQDDITSIVTTYFLHNNWGFRGVGDAWYNAASDYTTDGYGDNFRYFQVLCYNIHP